jgi:hypothetical protein
MHFKVLRWLGFSFLAVLLAGCSFLGSTPQQGQSKPIQNQATNTRAALSPTIDAVAEQVLSNMHLHSWNPGAQTRGVTTGGLFINWKMSNPQVTNAVNPGPDGNSQHNHDPQVDLLYLISLAEYHQLHPADSAHDTDIAHTTALVLADFQNYNTPKGWLYFYLLNAGTMLQNADLVNEAHTAASNFYKNWYDPQAGYVYVRNHHPGDYSVDHIFQCGAALIDAGTRWHIPDWVQAGQKTIDHTLQVALDPTYHQFYNSMIVGSNGQDSVQNYQAKPSTQGEAMQALLIAYELTHNQHYLDVVKLVLQTLFGSSGLWDKTQGGFYFALDMKKGKLLTDYKETRSQTLVLVALNHYNKIAAQAFAQQEQQLIQVISNNFYQHTYMGFFYRVTPDFRVYVSKPGGGIGVEDFFTTEAMGSAVDALQQTEM